MTVTAAAMLVRQLVRALRPVAHGSVAATELGYEFVHAVRNTCAVSAVDWVTFDCYGTLIDWEGGIYAALAPLLPRGIDRDELGQLYIAVEAEVERGQYLKYREVLNRASRLLLERLGRPLPETKPSPRSVTRRSTWRNTSRGRGTSRSRSWATSTARSCTWASAIAPSSAGTRS